MTERTASDRQSILLPRAEWEAFTQDVKKLIRSDEELLDAHNRLLSAYDELVSSYEQIAYTSQPRRRSFRSLFRRRQSAMDTYAPMPASMSISRRLCPFCRTELQPRDRFCPACGQRT